MCRALEQEQINHWGYRNFVSNEIFYHYGLMVQVKKILFFELDFMHLFSWFYICIYTLLDFKKYETFCRNYSPCKSK